MELARFQVGKSRDSIVAGRTTGQYDMLIWHSSMHFDFPPLFGWIVSNSIVFVKQLNIHQHMSFGQLHHSSRIVTTLARGTTISI